MVYYFIRQDHQMFLVSHCIYFLFLDRHHFDNPVYSTNFTTTNQPHHSVGPSGGQISSATLGQVVFPLNNVACVNRVVNRFITNNANPNATSSCKNNVNSDRERLRGFVGVEVRIPTAPPLQGDSMTNSRTCHDSFGHAASTSGGKYHA